MSNREKDHSTAQRVTQQQLGGICRRRRQTVTAVCRVRLGQMWLYLPYRCSQSGRIKLHNCESVTVRCSKRFGTVILPYNQGSFGIAFNESLLSVAFCMRALCTKVHCSTG